VYMFFVCVCVCVCAILLDTGSCYVAQAGLELAIFLLQPPKC
jgi:hypothetical protein